MVSFLTMILSDNDCEGRQLYSYGVPFVSKFNFQASAMCMELCLTDRT